MPTFLKAGLAVMVALMMGTFFLNTSAVARRAASGNAGGQTVVMAARHPHDAQGKQMPPRKMQHTRTMRANRPTRRYRWHRRNGKWYKKWYLSSSGHKD